MLTVTGTNFNRGSEFTSWREADHELRQRHLVDGDQCDKATTSGTLPVYVIQWDLEFKPLA